MKVAGIREVKNRLSQYLRWVAQGETVLVTDRGEVVAQLAPPPIYADGLGGAEREALERLARAGHLRLARPGTPPAAAGTLPPPSEPVDLAEELRRMREDRA
jgi:prevent-host-death family protein